MDKTKILLKRQVLDRVPYSGTHIYRLVKRGLFPNQVRIGANRVGWLESEVEEWLASKIATRNSTLIAKD